jgi:alpha-galactosidase
MSYTEVRLAARTEHPGEVVVTWSDDAIDVRIDIDDGGLARMTRLAAPLDRATSADRPLDRAVSADRPLDRAASGDHPADAALPLLDVLLAGEGRAWSGTRYCESQAGGRFRYAGHAQTPGAPGWQELRVDLDDPVTGLHAEVFLSILTGTGALRSWVRLTNYGTGPVTVEAVTSFLCGGLSSGTGGPENLADLDVMWAENDWLAEGRWQRRPLRDALPDLNRAVHGGDPRGCFGITSTGTWSTGTYLPAGAVVSRRTGHAWAWQIEHNGGWHWQVGECTHRSAAHGPGPGYGRQAPRGAAAGAYLALLGPADAQHHWRHPLAPGESFSTVPVSVAVSPAGFEGAVAALTAVRRAIRRPHADHRQLPVIFNDYMNTLMGDPTTDRLLPLITAAAEAGAEYFCIDSGWYAGLNEGWWDTVGAWKPSPDRFPAGLTEVLDHIRACGMIPGLWLEPEVVGVHSPVVAQLPADAFFRRAGLPVVEFGRYHLDLRHPAAVKHLDEVIDFLVADLGVGYLKLDYNVFVTPGPDTGGVSAGAGLLAANRAQLGWLDAVLDRHPGLVIENCASGAIRADYALLARLQLQSTSDQEDYLRCPPIAAAAPASIAPEQAAVWAYPQPGFSDDEIAFTLAGAMLGRIHLSGHLDRMSARQRTLVADAVAAYKRIRGRIAAAVPFWPLGLPGWTDSWIALGLRAPDVSYLTVWHRDLTGQPPADGQPQADGQLPADGRSRVILPVPHLRGQPVTPVLIYPGGVAEPAWDPAEGTLEVFLPRVPSACVIALTR